MPAASLRLGIDIGGTFTDFALVDGEGRRVGVHKRLTTPSDPARAVLEGVPVVLAEAGAAFQDLGGIVHGTTLVTNALIERRGPAIGMLVTDGFRDLFDIGKEQRYDLFDLRLRFAEPLVERHNRAEIPERLRHDGGCLVPLDEAAVEAATLRLVEQEGVAALAICFLHSHVENAHEARARDIVRSLFPDLPVSISSEVFPFSREFERWTTTCANACSQPLVEGYLNRLEVGLAAMGFAGRLAIVGSSGGLLTPETARRFPVRLLESGPAAGVTMSARLGRDQGRSSLLSFDLGGTTAKGALVRDGRPLRKYSFEAAHAYEYRSGSGLQLQIPVVDMTEIGVGGGSLASIDELGRLRVGPRSAGADPGPACYGQGGVDPTLTDANLLLGYLDPDFFNGGRLKLDPPASRMAIRDGIGTKLDLPAERAAWGVHDVANENIARAFRMHATERGFDYRDCTMVAFGGGGPIHAVRIARKLRVPEVICPAGAGVMSAFGMLAGSSAFEAVRADPRLLSELTEAHLAGTLHELAAEARKHLGSSLAAVERDHAVERRVDMRYRGQGYDIEVPLPPNTSPAELLRALPALFAQSYETVFHTVLSEPIEIVSWKVEVSGRPPATFGTAPALPDAVGQALKGYRAAYFPALGGFAECPVYARERLAPGTVVIGPALVEEAESTCLLDVEDRGRIDADRNLVIAVGAEA